MTVKQLRFIIEDLPDDLPIHLAVNNHTASRGDEVHAMHMRYGSGAETTRNVLGLWNYIPWKKDPCPNDPVLISRYYSE